MVIAARDIPRWVQPAPTTTTGIAEIRPTGDPQAQVAGAAPALATIGAPAATAATATGTAEILYSDDLQLITRVGADAQVVLDNTAKVEDHLGVAAGIALITINAASSVQTTHDCPVTLLIVARLDAAPQVSGDAEVSMADYGQGSVPIFPFRLPTQFTDNPLGIQDAGAEMIITGDSFDGGGGGYADAVVRMSGPNTFDQQGNTPIFPFGFPIVFTDAANIQRGYATAPITAPGALVAELAGDAQAAITAEGIQANPAQFPMTLPVVLA